MKKWKIIDIILAALFISTLLLIILKINNTIDNSFYNFIIKFKNHNLTTFFKLITNFGGTCIIVIGIIILLAIFKDYNKRLLIFTSIITSTITNLIFKNIIGRPRPNVDALVMETSKSFPSGHTMATTILYGLIIYFIYNSNLNKYLKIALISIIIILMMLIYLSRIYLGVHYFTDVLGGLTLALLILNTHINIIMHKNV